ncbi:14 kDa phosphohistidine phosphatase [Ambystoma mexicanum]|uniref:14 kDa phosphohistidine phosphatase n=1 Tax=Ambystoma mexicanum TaxID=8296 RepID=UPI0037E9AE63
MAAQGLANIADVDIDADGVFKYVLIRVRPARGTDDEGKDIVRGFGWAEYHADIYDKVSGEIEKQGFDCECLGGGRISHNSQQKKIHVYGYSMGFGRADHSVSTGKIKSKYPGYTVTWGNEGY